MMVIPGHLMDGGSLLKVRIQQKSLSFQPAGNWSTSCDWGVIWAMVEGTFRGYQTDALVVSSGMNHLSLTLLH